MSAVNGAVLIFIIAIPVLLVLDHLGLTKAGPVHCTLCGRPKEPSADPDWPWCNACTDIAEQSDARSRRS